VVRDQHVRRRWPLQAKTGKHEVFVSGIERLLAPGKKMRRQQRMHGYFDAFDVGEPKTLVDVGPTNLDQIVNEIQIGTGCDSKGWMEVR